MLALSLALAALVPKCPMCLAVYLSLLGLGGLAGVAHPYLRPAACVLAALALLVLLSGKALGGKAWLARQRARRAS